MSNLPTDKIISSFYSSSQDCVKVIDGDGMLMSFNPHGLSMMEIDDESQVIGKAWLDFWRGDVQDKAATALVKAQSGELARFEGYCPTFKGTMKYWEVSIAPLFDDYGQLMWLLVISRDTTSQKELEKLARKQSKRIEQLEQQLLVVRN